MPNPRGWTLIHSFWQAAVAWAALSAFRRRAADPVARYRAGTVALALLLATQVTTLAACVARPGHSPLSWTNPAEVRVNEDGLIARPPPLVAGWPAAAVERVSSALPWLLVACGVWFMIRLGHHARVALRLSRVLAVAPPLPDGALQRCEEARSALDVRAPVRFVEAAIGDAPGTVGWRRPIIYFPPAALAAMTPAHVEAIAAHELAHVARRDYFAATLRLAVETVYAPNPFVARLVAAAEDDAEACCDAVVVAHIADRREYAEMLASLATRAAEPKRVALGADGGSLRTRVLAILAPPRPQGIASLWARAAGSLVAATVVLALSGVSLARVADRQAEARWLAGCSLPAAVEAILEGDRSPSAQAIRERARSIGPSGATEVRRMLIRRLFTASTYGDGFDAWRRERLMTAAMFDSDRLYVERKVEALQRVDATASPPVRRRRPTAID